MCRGLAARRRFGQTPARMTFEALTQHLVFALGLALLSAAVVRAMIRWPILDIPNGRSAHAVATPRGGGVGVVVAFLCGMLVLYGVANFARLAERQFLGVILAALAIAGVALADDIRNLSARLRLLAQVGAALVAVGTGITLSRLALPYLGVVELGWVGALLTVFWIVGCTNAVNFMDGLDGLVGGTLLIACIALAVIAAGGGRALHLHRGADPGRRLRRLPALQPASRPHLHGRRRQPVRRLHAGGAGGGGGALRFHPAQLPDRAAAAVRAALRCRLHPAAARLDGGPVGAPHRTHLYQMAQRSGMGVRRVAAVHWGFALFHAGLAGLFLQLASWAKPLIVLPALAVQCGWLWLVARRVRRAGLGWRG